MFYPSDFEIKRTKEQEIRERVQRAEMDRLAQSVGSSPRLLARLAHGATRRVGHVLLGLGKRLEAFGVSETASHHRRTA